MRWLAVFAPLVLVACSLTWRSSSNWYSHTMIGLADQCGPASFAIECNEEHDRLSMDIAIRATAGGVHVRLIDPCGQCRVDDVVRGERTQSLELSPLPGAWRCKLDYDHFDGDCAIELTASGGTCLAFAATAR